MARSRHRLTAAQARQTNEPALVADGGGLYLQVTEPKGGGTLRKSWLLRFTAPDGRRREMGLGSLTQVSLAEARQRAEEARNLAARGVDPIEARKKQRTTRGEADTTLSFKDAASAYIAAHTGAWSNAKHAWQWTRSLEMYAYPVFGDTPVSDVDVGLVLQAIEPIWGTKTETASRVRGRIEAILDWAAVRGYRSTENPARWRGHLQRALPERSKIAPVQHHRALPIDEMPDFMATLKLQSGIAPLAFAFCILTASRTSETLGAIWQEIDAHDAIWTIPAIRMKARRPHRVPLSASSLAIIRQVKALGGDPWLFPSPRGNDRPLSNMAFIAVTKRMGRTDITPHGFRSTFRDWVAERTDYPNEVAEAALAHTVTNRVEAAYRRGDLFEKRRVLMEDWAGFCGGRKPA